MEKPPSRQQLDHLCDVELENYQGKKPAISHKRKIGEYLISGEGAVFGSNLNGIVEWSLSQEVEDIRCGFSLVGEIITDDRAAIRFDSMGHIRTAANSGRHQLTGSIWFETDSVQYSWLNNLLGVIQGYYDMDSFRHSYRMYTHRID